MKTRYAKTSYALFKTMRPHQWTKNVIIFAALVFDVKLLSVRYTARAIAGFLLFCLISGVVYTINDLVDLEKDRQHPRKRNRPLASGALSPRLALGAVMIIIIIALPAAVALDMSFALILFDQ